MVGEARRQVIRRQYRLWRAAVEKTQLQVETLARLDAGRYWKIENGVVFPTADERKAIARVLRINEADLPSLEMEAKAS